MVKYTALALVVALAASCTESFTPQPLSSGRNGAIATKLNAIPPPMIIGPMIRKMREEQEKKKMPMASSEESQGEAPGLRVGGSAWKWPPVWPYDQDFFTPKADLASKNAPNLPQMAGMANGMQTLSVPEEDEDKPAFDPIQYWSEEKADAETKIDEEAIAKLKSHYAFYLRDGMSVLELGAAENSYLPEGLKLSRHVGVGANSNLMEKNSALTESHVIDLNKVEEEKGIDSEQLKQIAAEPFDAIIMANTIDFLTHPREVFKSAWYMLKPGGTMMVAFSGKDTYPDEFGRAMTRMWRDYNDDQHMWVCGSFFQFSAGDGWENLRGFDLSPEGSKSVDDDGIFAVFKGGKNTNLFLVQADRGAVADSIDPADPEKFFKSRMWMLPVMEDRDKMLVSPRLRRTYEKADDYNLGERLQYLPKIYESLIKMDQFAFTFSMQAQLAVDLVSDPDFKANDEQIVALKQGLGLRTPSADFWEPVGRLTASMPVEEKINLLAHIVPRFGSGDAEQEQSLQAFVTGLEPTFAFIRSKCPGMTEEDVQLLGAELLASEVLKPGRSGRDEFAAWLGALTSGELESMLAARKQTKLDAQSELNAYRVDKQEKLEALEAQKKKMEEQVQAARENRSMTFNPETGKFEELKKKKKK